MTDSISFTGRYINTSYIKRINPDKTLSDVKVALVEVSPYSPADFEAAKTVRKNWVSGDDYVDTIVDHMDLDSYENPLKRFFALTLQKKKYQNMQPEKILAMLQTGNKRGDSIHIDYLQVDPANMRGSKNREYKEIGKTAIKAIKKLFDDRKVTLISESSVSEFYKKIGCEELYEDFFLVK